VTRFWDFPAATPPPVWNEQVKWNLKKSYLIYYSYCWTSLNNPKWFKKTAVSKRAEKVIVTFCRPPSKKKCHVLFEWPPCFLFHCSGNIYHLPLFPFFVVWSIYSDEIHTRIFLEGFVVWLNFAKKETDEMTSQKFLK